MRTATRTISDVFGSCCQDRRAAFIAFLTAGFPSLELTPELVRAACEGGADIIELGFPYSDPLADGPIIQASSQRALENGATFDAVLELAPRCAVDVPLIAFTYYNPLFVRGLEQSVGDLRDAGFSGAIMPDLPPEEADELVDALRSAGLSAIFLIAPTTPLDRAKAIAPRCSGFVYVAGRLGVTGTHAGVDDALRERVEGLRAVTHQPLAVGFGISKPEHVRVASMYADGVIAGSAVVEASDGRDPVVSVRDLCFKLREAVSLR